MIDQETIVQYYENTLPSYRKFWYRNSESYALHYGFWSKTTKNLNEALLNTNKFIARQANIQPGHLVLDAGCGVGGSSIWLAKNIGAKVTGITISPKQVQEATRLAKANQVEQLTDFYLRSYLNTEFPDNSFDIVWAVESVCHAKDKEEFLREAFRLLKTGGKVIIADGFSIRDPKNEKEVRRLKEFYEGLAVPNVAKVNDFRNSLEKVGFTAINYWDKTDEVFPSAWRLYLICCSIYPLLKIIKPFKKNSRKLEILEKNGRAGIVQYQVLKDGLGSYGVFYGEK